MILGSFKYLEVILRIIFLILKIIDLLFEELNLYHGDSHLK